jgi:mRNA degradation ribonuclease J1/J2
MKMWVLIFFAATLVTFPGVSFGITFVIWETGMSINEVVSLARENDIPIGKDGLIHGYKKFDPKLIDGNFYKASTLYYRTNLSGRNSVVYLRLTDDPKFIREIEVRLFGITNRELFTEEMIKILSQKYGSYKEVRETAFRFYQWRPDKYSQVRMRVSSAEASIIYTDLRIKEHFENQRREKEKKSIKKDSDKF